MHDYVRKILAARVYDVAVQSPLDAMPRLSQRLGNRVLLKREDLQPIFSFKLRGAYNKIAGLPPELLERGVICASAGNHAQGVALAAEKLGIKAVIVMPRTTPGIKVQAVRSRGGRVVLHGDTFDEAFAHARELHLAVPPPQPWRRSRPCACRHPGARGRPRPLPALPRRAWLSLLGRDRQPRLPSVPR
jgi:threonine dehydratase